MKNIVNILCGLTLFLIENVTSKCNMYSGVANCSSTNLRQVPILNKTKHIEVIFFYFRYLEARNSYNSDN